MIFFGADPQIADSQRLSGIGLSGTASGRSAAGIVYIELHA